LVHFGIPQYESIINNEIKASIFYGKKHFLRQKDFFTPKRFDAKKHFLRQKICLRQKLFVTPKNIFYAKNFFTPNLFLKTTKLYAEIFLTNITQK